MRPRVSRHGSGFVRGIEPFIAASTVTVGAYCVM